MIEYSPDFFDLCYHNTDTKIMLGDNIIYSTWFGLKKIKSTICYVPGVSPPHKDMEDSDISAFWVFTCGEHDVIPMLYVTTDKFVPKSIKFVSRAKEAYKGLQPNEPIS